MRVSPPCIQSKGRMRERARTSSNRRPYRDLVKLGLTATFTVRLAVLRTSGFTIGSFSKVLDIIARTGMAIKPGTRIGPYEVTSPLGEGGMGVVFRAHDTKLQRDVALKLLPDHFADDPERLARFQREAQVLASLNHP